MLLAKKTEFAIFITIIFCNFSMANPKLLDLFPKSEPYDKIADSKTTISNRYYKSSSSWNLSLDEKDVFLSELKYEQGINNSYAFRIGKGGQLYSLRSAFGESVPPSSQESPWNDEVWQFVAVCLKYNNLSDALPKKHKDILDKSGYKSSYFIHNSGAYIHDPKSPISNLYCPLFATETTADNKAIRTLNWGLVPQIRSIHRSPLLYYFQGRNLGDGVIELTYVVHNFSSRDDVVFDHLNAPWGGTRVSALPHHYATLADGTLIDKAKQKKLNFQDGKEVQETAGFNISSMSLAKDSPSLAFVYGLDKHLERELALQKAGKPFCQYAPSIYRAWDAIGDYQFSFQDWQERPEHSWRNYDVAVVIPKFNLAPQTSIWYRSFLVVGEHDKVIKKAKKLIDKVDYGLMTFESKGTPKMEISLLDGEIKIDNEHGKKIFNLYSKPVPNSMPLFLIKNSKTNKTVVTSDPYIFVDKEKIDLKIDPNDKQLEYYQNTIGYSLDQNNSSWENLLGFALIKKPQNGNFKKLSELLPREMLEDFNDFNLDLWVELDEKNLKNVLISENFDNEIIIKPTLDPCNNQTGFRYILKNSKLNLYLPTNNIEPLNIIKDADKNVLEIPESTHLCAKLYGADLFNNGKLEIEFSCKMVGNGNFKLNLRDLYPRNHHVEAGYFANYFEISIQPNLISLNNESLKIKADEYYTYKLTVTLEDGSAKAVLKVTDKDNKTQSISCNIQEKIDEIDEIALVSSEEQNAKILLNNLSITQY